MRNELRKEIKRLSQKALSKARAKEESEEKYREKFARRTGLTPGVKKARLATIPHRHFDPIHCKRHASLIASGIWHKVLAFSYEPEPAVDFEIPKADGTKRTVTAFGIPDAALANVLLRRTMSRNRKRFSPHSYAYHPDKNVFDAILAIKDFDRDGKYFAVQIDFRKYFDTIPSSYLKKKIGDRSVIGITPHEEHICHAFLHHRHCKVADYGTGKFRTRVKGTPQGSSASLILANVANHDLDRMLSAESGKFVRFADDVLAICGDYQHAQELERCFDRHCRRSGIEVNREKSPGIAVLAEFENEIRTIKDFTYLGYRFSETGLAMPTKTATKLQQKVSRLINIYLFHALQFGFNPDRASRKRQFDWDLLGLIYELRRGLYGGLRETDIRGFLDGSVKLKSMRGLMGFYCLIEDPELLRDLDGWILNTVRRACVARNNLLFTKYKRRCPTPSNKELVLGTWLSQSAWRDLEDKDTKDELEVVFPSLVRGWRAARKHFFTFGLEGVQAPGYDSSIDPSSLFDALLY